MGRYGYSRPFTGSEVSSYYAARVPKLHRSDKSQWRGPCPIHDGTDENFAVEPTSGAWYCHSQCGRGGSMVDLEVALSRSDSATARKAVFEAVGRVGTRVQRGRARGPKRLREVAVYDYKSETGETRFQVVRFEGEDPTTGVRTKTFRQRRPTTDGWAWNLKGVELIPYRFAQLRSSAGTVYIAEGEKDVHTLEALGLTATCNPMGAGKWRSEYSPYFAGLDVVILPDNDEPGRSHAEAVLKSLLPHVKSVRLVELPGLAPKGDVTDWAASGGNRQQLEALVTATATVKLEPERETTDAERQFPFFSAPDGWYWRDSETGTSIRLSGPFQIVASTCNEHSTNHGRLLEWLDARGHQHRYACPLSLFAGDGNDVRERLLDGGLMLEPGRKARERLAILIQTHPSTAWVRSVSRVGWHADVFVLPEVAIGPEGREKTVYQGHGIAHSFRQAGTLREWQQEVAARCSGNSRLMFAVSMALAGPLLQPLGEQSGGIHLVGGTSTGKSTILHVAASVWGGGQSAFVRSWSATVNGLEAVAELHNDSILILDELHSANPKSIVEVVYALGNGVGRARMNRNLALRPVIAWRTLFLSSGEITLEEHASKAGERPPGGAEVRMLNVPADAGAGLGAFEALHGERDARSFADRLRLAASKTYGTAGPEFVRYLVNHHAEVREIAAKLRQEFVSTTLPSDAASEVGRACQRFALIAAAGELAVQAGISPWEPGDARRAAERCFQDWLTNRETNGGIDAERAIAQVRQFLGEHGASRFQSLSEANTPERISHRAGFRRKDSDGGVEYLVLPDVFKAEVCRGLNHKSVLVELERRGFLKREDQRWTLKPRTPEGIIRVHCIGGEILE